MKHIYTIFSAAVLSLAFSFANAATPMSDAEVLGLLGTANDGEINMAQVAVSKAQNTDVKAFAARMVADHTANNVKLKAVEVKSSIARVESDQSKELKKNMDQMVDTLKKTPDASFDKTYIDGQVAGHQQLLMALDQTLIPNAQNADVKAYLQDTRTAVEEHLKAAQDLQSKIK
jgi:putative membrane protein